MALVGAFALFLQSNRFGLADAGSGAVYKIDRKTGKTWMVVGNREVDVLSSSQQQAATSEDKSDALDLGKAAFRGNYFVKATVVDLVKKSKALGPDFTVETFVGSKVSKLNRPIELKGWTPEEVAPALWLVSSPSLRPASAAGAANRSCFDRRYDPACHQPLQRGKAQRFRRKRRLL